MSLVEAIREGMSIRAPKETQEKIQASVASHLDSLSPGASVKLTGYFNHSWAPDLVIDSSELPERRVFLRFGVRDASFEDDLAYLAPESPFFLDLIGNALDAGAQSNEDDFDLSSALSAEERGGVLVSEVGAIDQFESRASEDQRAKAATKQVVVGGHGVVDPPAASRIVESWERANEAAGEAGSERVRSALDEVERYLNREASLDLETELRSVWVNAGHDADAFPGMEDWELADRGPDELADLVGSLLDRGDEVSRAQWTEIVRAISASALGDQLFARRKLFQGGTVNDLVRAGLEYWTARYAYVPPLESDLFAGRFNWSLGGNALALNLVRRQAYFTDNGRKWNRKPKPEQFPLASERLARLDHPDVLGAGLQTPEVNYSQELRASATSSLAEQLGPQLDLDASWRSARLRWLELRVPGTEITAEVDFSRNVVTAGQSIPLRAYALMIGEFVAALTEEELAELAESLRGGD